MPKWLKIVAMSVPAVMVALGIFMARETWIFQNGSEAASGRVVSVRLEFGSTTGSDGFSETTVSHYPTVQYTDTGGQTYVSESSQPASGFIPKVGEIIPVRYYAENPNWVRPVFSLWTLWAGPMIFAGIGGFFLILLGVVFRIIDRADARRRGPEQEPTVRRL